jgi:two-component system LytT family sensor kinase
VKNCNWRIGIPFAILIAFIAVMPILVFWQKSDLGEYASVAIHYFVFALMSWYGNHRLYTFFPFSKNRYRTELFFVTTVSAGMLLAILYSEVIYLMTGWYARATDNSIFLVFFRGTLYNSIIAFVVFHLSQMRANQQSQLELERMKQAQLQANLSSLKEQLSPHFLFNTLNTLNSLTREQDVKNYVAELANVYGYLLSYHKSDLATLRQELAFTESYLYIVKMRLKNAIQISITIDADVLDTRIPPLTLQLLMENAVKHNITVADSPLRIALYVEEHHLVAENSMRPKSSVQHGSGIGLTNIVERYRILLGKTIIIETKNDLFIVKLPLHP